MLPCTAAASPTKTHYNRLFSKFIDLLDPLQHLCEGWRWDSKGCQYGNYWANCQSILIVEEARNRQVTIQADCCCEAGVVWVLFLSGRYASTIYIQAIGPQRWSNEKATDRWWCRLIAVLGLVVWDLVLSGRSLMHCCCGGFVIMIRRSWKGLARSGEVKKYSMIQKRFYPFLSTTIM